MAGWQKTGDLHDAVCYGHVAASFALEQIGMPLVEERDGEVVCNGVGVMKRLKEYRRRLGETKVVSEQVL